MEVGVLVLDNHAHHLYCTHSNIKLFRGLLPHMPYILYFGLHFHLCLESLKSLLKAS